MDVDEDSECIIITRIARHAALHMYKQISFKKFAYDS